MKTRNLVFSCLSSFAAAMCCLSATADELPPSLQQLYQGLSPIEGFVVSAENRFNPWVQRMMAERSLKSFALADGELYYIYPMNVDPRFEEMQIRYVEQLLEKQKKDEPKSE